MQHVTSSVCPSRRRACGLMLCVQAGGVLASLLHAHAHALFSLMQRAAGVHVCRSTLLHLPEQTGPACVEHCIIWHNTPAWFRAQMACCYHCHSVRFLLYHACTCCHKHAACACCTPAPATTCNCPCQLPEPVAICMLRSSGNTHQSMHGNCACCEN